MEKHVLGDHKGDLNNSFGLFSVLVGPTKVSLVAKAGNELFGVIRRLGVKFKMHVKL